ncbi:MAG: hypothetical protein H6607_09405 [Flavobacteriales bacterium]|nr:hypothetical protein [Flavobacteriales bacterium]
MRNSIKILGLIVMVVLSSCSRQYGHLTGTRFLQKNKKEAVASNKSSHYVKPNVDVKNVEKPQDEVLAEKVDKVLDLNQAESKNVSVKELENGIQNAKSEDIEVTKTSTQTKKSPIANVKDFGNKVVQNKVNKKVNKIKSITESKKSKGDSSNLIYIILVVLLVLLLIYLLRELLGPLFGVLILVVLIIFILYLLGMI